MIADLFSLEGRVALITGGNSGIGRALAFAFRDAGAKVVIGARRADRNAATLRDLGEEHGAVEVDVCDESAVERAVANVTERYGRLDVLVNNAGAVNRKSIMEMELAAWNYVMNVNVNGAFLCTKYAARVMKGPGSGKIINISSVYGLISPSRGLQPAYATAKHALIGLTRTTAVELASCGIQVNAIAPGYFLTEMTAELNGTPLMRALEKRTPDGRLGECEDLVGAAIFLASKASDHVTGVCIPVDGGYLASDGLDRG
jgi:2-dehydro-3-deoxy-D-gluconate 5-dehydrogenase